VHEVVLMVKMSKTQASKRLLEAQRKVDSVAFGDASRFLTTSQRTKLYGISNQLIALAKDLK
jgi:hypothetical protein